MDQVMFQRLFDVFRNHSWTYRILLGSEQKIMRKQLQVYRSLGTALSVGWPRDDVPTVIHVFAQAEPGASFKPEDGYGNPHWPCRVCKAHGFTESDFRDQILGALERGHL